MSKCKFTIITVCYNAKNHITDTILSVLDQTYQDFEYIIKDGQSADETMDIVHRLTDSDNRVMIIEGKDQGIYDAMNQAVLSAQGEYILFLNAGDLFAGKDVLNQVSCYMEEHTGDILYGDVIEVTGEKRSLRVFMEKNSKMWYYSLGACLCHQGMFCRRNLFQNKLFDLTYKVCADREWQMYHIKHGATAAAMKFPVAEVLTEGFSKSHIAELEKETKRCVKQYCGSWYVMYRFLVLLKKNRVLSSLIREAEQAVSCR